MQGVSLHQRTSLGAAARIFKGGYGQPPHPARIYKCGFVGAADRFIGVAGYLTACTNYFLEFVNKSQKIAKHLFLIQEGHHWSTTHTFAATSLPTH